MSKNLALEFCSQVKEYTTYINNYKQQEFLKGTKVMVNTDRYRGPGIVSGYNSDLPVDKIPVLLENGNVWYYLFEDCEVIR